MKKYVYKRTTWNLKYNTIENDQLQNEKHAACIKARQVFFHHLHFTAVTFSQESFWFAFEQVYCFNIKHLFYKYVKPEIETCKSVSRAVYVVRYTFWIITVSDPCFRFV